MQMNRLQMNELQMNIYLVIERVNVVGSHELRSTVLKTQLSQNFLFASLCWDSHMHIDNKCNGCVQVMNTQR